MKPIAFLLLLSSGAAAQEVRQIIVRPDVRSETGKPFSATVTETTSQTLEDGTHVTRSTVTLEYRDPEGRTRQEVTSQTPPTAAQTRVLIQDPVAAVTYTLFPNEKAASRNYTSVPLQVRPVGGGFGPTPAARGGAGINLVRRTVTAPGDTSGGFAGKKGGRAGNNGQTTTSEDLGTIAVNGIMAHGTKSITTIPVGAIGNDREFHSVTESWYSPELNLLIKSVSSDPRFGTTTYELTNISRNPPDPALFRLPADYTIR